MCSRKFSSALAAVGIGVLFGAVEGADRQPVASVGDVAAALVSDAAPTVAAGLESYIPAPDRLLGELRVEEHVGIAEGGDVPAVAKSTDSFLVYSNTRGKYVTGPAGAAATAKVADDVAVTALSGCQLDKYVIRVTGDRDGSGSAPTFDVSMALYRECPGAGGITAIPGTGCTFAALAGTGIQQLTCAATTGPALRDNFYVGVSFSRDDCGVIVGAPPELGFSADQLDWPGFPCGAYLGGYPDFPHASFWLEVYTQIDCAKSFVAYKNSNHAGNAYTPGAGIRFADDISLGVAACSMVAYEVAVKGPGVFAFDLRTFLSNSDPETGGVIPGTEKMALSASSQPQVVRFAIDPPISLPPSLYIGFKSSNAVGGPIFTNRPAALGSTQDQFCVYEEGAWQCGPYSPQTYAAFDVTIMCSGEPPVGACCDLVLTDDQNEAVCGQLPQMNCGFPELWIESTVCDSTCVGGTNNGQPCTRQADCPGYSCVGGTNAGNPCVLNSDCPGGFCRRARCPGPFAFPCGQSACCTHDDYCFNYTENECNARPPLDKPRLWERGEFCGYQGFSCPWGACLDGEGLCSLPHPWPGCEDPYCCTAVCRIDPFCCLVEWDEQCAANTFRYCSAAPANDECWDPDAPKGARLVSIPSSTEGDNLHATENTDDPGFCCHKEDPDAIGYGTVWYKFVATQSSASLKTCYSNSPATDSLLSVYESADPDRGICEDGASCSVAAQDCADGSDCVPDDQYACANLNLVGCSDDVQGCSSSNKNSSLCVTNLTVGQTYYVLVASKPDINPGDYPQLAYRLDVVSPCTNPRPPIPNDFCQDATDLPGLEEVVEPFDLSGGTTYSPATFHCPGDPCIDPLMLNDLWYTWTSPCTGYTRVTTCDPALDPEDQAPTTMVVYNACRCPVQAGTVVGCNSAAGGECGLSAAVGFNATENQCYLIRLGGRSGGTPSGNLRVHALCSCDSDDDCEDYNVCTDDVCEAGQCVNTPNAGPCELDGNLCTMDHCNGAGACVTYDNVNCADPVPPCDGGEQCNPATGNCDALPDAALSTPCNLDGDWCTGEHCDGNGACVDHPPYDVVCQDPIPPCEGGQHCNPADGQCVNDPDAPLSTPCELDANLCSSDHCNGIGACVTYDNVDCQDPAPPCEGGEECDPATGQCDALPDAPLSTPCEFDGNLCTIDHCDGTGSCVNYDSVDCPGPVPPCEGGQHCNPAGGQCVNDPDAPLSTPCERDADACTKDHCNGGGACVFQTNICGACCFADGTCSGGMTETACVAAGGEFKGIGSVCLGDQNGDGKDDLCVPSTGPIPTVTEWGLAALTLLLLTGGKICFARRSAPQQS